LFGGVKMLAMQQESSTEAEFATVPEAARRNGVSPKTLRRAARLGCFPTFSFGTAWPRVRLADVERWIISTRTPTSDHASNRVAEVLAAESAKSTSDEAKVMTPGRRGRSGRRTLSQEHGTMRNVQEAQTAIGANHTAVARKGKTPERLGESCYEKAGETDEQEIENEQPLKVGS